MAESTNESPTAPIAETPSPPRLKKSFEAWTKAFIGEISLSGKENIAEAKRSGKPILVVSTHISDLDVPVAVGTLAKDLDMVIAHISGQRHFRTDPLTRVGLAVAGEENFIPIDFSKISSGWSAGPFNSLNFVPMVTALKEGKAVFIAAHSPVRNNILPPKGGVGAVYLSHLADDAIILPVAVDIGVKREDIGKNTGTFKLLSKRPSAHLTIGAPFQLPPLTSLNKEALRDQSAILMQNLASMLPVEKRGTWNQPTLD
jgi:hypothetical protein